MECAERGLLKNTWAAGLRFGDGAGTQRLLEDIAYRRGIGDLLAEGVRAAAAEIGGGSEAFAIQVKGLELPAYDPRAGFGSGLTYSVNPRGACHRRAWPPAKEVLGGVPPYTIEGKPAMVKEQFQYRHILHSMIVCDMHNGTGLIPIEEYLEFVRAVTGEDPSMDRWLLAEDRTETVARLINLREGFGRKDDALPKRLLFEPLPDGPAKGQLFGSDGLNHMLDEYYALRGWDREGVPLPETLERLGLAEYAPDMPREELL
jgi:aldehyde:ferredoxin oxidoreductase